MFNLNDTIRVRISDAGIEHYLKKFNNDIPFRLQISFKDFKSIADVEGFHKMQAWELFNAFGSLGLRISDFISTEILICK